MSETEWSVNRLSAETGLDRRTITRILAGEAPSLRALVRNLMNRSRGLTKRREELLEVETALKNLELEERRGRLVDLDDLCQKLSPRYSNMRSIVQNAERLSDDEKRDLLEQLHHAHATITPPAPPTPEPAESAQE